LTWSLWPWFLLLLLKFCRDGDDDGDDGGGGGRFVDTEAKTTVSPILSVIEPFGVVGDDVVSKCHV
jgi:hypothetical protein